ncbi:MAG: flagellar biosynthesis regulator FlaF [Syntrophorhabdaceae bacterium]|nr:flagellar biosynthesis regulator FlaF [Syntrophorhabdaceae bacterium]HBL24181.1 flagellar biosynthesis regulatory protein FlaF [Deltaproteobacteria bacterium]
MSAGINAYKQTIKSTLSGRELEASILSKAARLLKSCQEHWNEEGHFKRLDEALTFNQRVWTIFQDELIREDNPLPAELRGDILNLSVFIDKRIVEIMNDPSPDKLDIIININFNLAAGLRGSSE